MGNANGREDGGNGMDDPYSRSNGLLPVGREPYGPNFPGRVISSELMAHSPPPSPSRSRSPLLFSPQVPLAPLPRSDAIAPPFHSQIGQAEPQGVVHSNQGGIPIVITWMFGGTDVAVEGSWDNWSSRKKMQRSGKDHTLLMVLPSGIYHYKFIVDGEWRYIPDLPHISDQMGRHCNLLDINAHVPENPDSIAEFEHPPSPESSYSQLLPTEEDFSKEPASVPPQLHLTVLGAESFNKPSSPRPQHVVLNHLFIEKGRASHSIVALGLTHRFQSKYVTVVFYKPLRR